jgi:hypothetical protein
MKKRARKQAKAGKTLRRGLKSAGSKIRESDEARALLEEDLNRLYWWVFNASRMKGFIWAKGLHEAAERQLNASRDSETSNLKESPILTRKDGGK